MKPLAVMDEAEMIVFCNDALRIIEASRGMQKTAPELRVALIALWTMNRDRPVTNLKTHYEADPSSFLDEAVRGGTIFFENIGAMLSDPPPHFAADKVQFMRKETEQHIRTLRDPRYREHIVRAWEGFLEDLKEHGE